MTALTDNQIQKCVSNGSIVIDPFEPKHIAPSAYYFTLGPIILIPLPGQTINLAGGEDPKYQKLDISETGYTIKPQEFILAQTLEKLTLGQNVLMLVDGRTTTARLGLSIHQTATLIHPGHTKSIITLELFNASPFSITLHKGDKIGKGLFFECSNLANQAYNETGIYKVQEEPMGADVPPYGNQSSS